ncbi:MAG: M48 family metalloprotease, partial [Verrucomicrobiota bacterium]
GVFLTLVTGSWVLLTIIVIWFCSTRGLGRAIYQLLTILDGRTKDIRRFDWFPTIIFSLPLLVAVVLAVYTPFEWLRYGIGYLVFATILLVAIGYGGSYYFCKWLGLIKPADEEVTRWVHEEMSALEGSYLPAVYQVDTWMANAVAFVNHKAVGFTAPALRELTEPEVRAVARHELAHLLEPRSVKIARSLSGLTFLPLVMFKPLMTQFSFFVALITAILGWAILTMLFQRLSRAMEERADQIGEGDGAEAGEPRDYASALVKLYKMNLVPAVISKRPEGSHPELYDRIKSIDDSLDFERPLPPELGRAKALGWIATILALAAAVGLFIFFNAAFVSTDLF